MTDMKKIPTKQLWNRFLGVLERTASAISELAEIWVELDRRGEDLTRYRNPMFAYLPAVARGNLLPEALVRFGSYPPVMDAVSKICPEDQTKVLNDGTVSVLTTEGETCSKRVIDLYSSEIKQVFGDGKIRTPAEQRPFLTDRPVDVAEYSRREPGRGDRVTVQVEMGRKQWEAAKSKAKNSGMSLSDYIVNTLVRSKAVPAEIGNGRKISLAA